MKKQYVSAKEFQDLRYYDEAEDDVVYVIKNKDETSVYGWSPDGKSFVFYANYKEFVDSYKNVESK